MIDALFGKIHNDDTYNCAHFVADAYKHLTGREIMEDLQTFLRPPEKRTAPLSMRHRWRRLRYPKDGCVVLLRRPRTPSHVGLWYEGKVIHLTAQGVQFQPVDIAAMGYKTTGFYSCE